MSMWQNAKKHAKSFGMKGFLYGAAIGAAFAVVALVAILGGFSIAGMVPQLAPLISADAIAKAGAGIQMMANGLSSLTWGLAGATAAGGAAAGAFLGGVCSATAGGFYGAAIDESNPLPRVVDNAANKIITKTPELAKAIAAKVSMQEEAGQQLAAQGGVQTAPEAPIITQPIAEMTRKQQQPTASFQERVVTQAKEAELAAAQR